MATTTTFNALAVTVAVSGPEPSLERIGRYFPEGFAEFGDSNARIVLSLVKPASLQRSISRLQRRPHDRTANGHPSLTYAVWDDCETGACKMVPLSESPHVLTIRRGGGFLLDIRVTAGDEVTLGRTAVRVMRQLMLRTSERLLGCGAHGAAVAHGGKGIVLAGVPGAGKSTVALALAARFGADLVASDRIVFVPGGRQYSRWVVSGIPVPWRLADGTINALPQLRRSFSEEMQLLRGNELVDGKHELVTDELSQMVNVQSRLSVPLHHIVVLSREPGRAVSVRELAWNERFTALQRTLFNPADQLFVTDWLGLSVPTAGQLFSRSAVLANRVRIYQATWPTHDSIPAVALSVAARLGLHR